MKVLAPNPRVDLYNQGFDEPDILQRIKVGKALSDLLERTEDPLVIALDGPWGAGKSYFLKRWVGAHGLQNEGTGTTVFFDAFANDYLSDPLTALVSALGARMPASSRGKIDQVKTAAFKLAKPMARIALAVGTYGATEALGKAEDVIAEATSDETTKAIDAFWKQENGRHAAMNQFKSAMEALLEGADDQEATSLIIVVDELDRCRPDYALEVLEVIEHFFAVPNVHFILGANLEALENSVKMRYGSENDAALYLSKFIDVTLSLPSEIGDAYAKQPAPLVYLKALTQEMGTPQHLAVAVESHLKLVMHANQISIRDIDKIVSALALADKEVLARSNFLPGWIDVMITLVVTKVIRPDLYPKFLNCSMNGSDLLGYLGRSEREITKNIDGKYNRSYDHASHTYYLTWIFLFQYGSLTGEEESLITQINARFEKEYDLDAPRDLPRRVHRRWLDLFDFYNG